MMEFPTVEKFVKDVGNLVLDDFTYKGKSLREWVDILSKYECLGWIPAEHETNPTKDGWYITTADGEICGEDHPVVGINEFENGKWDEDKPDYKCVLAWMPLPEPYKGEKP